MDIISLALLSKLKKQVSTLETAHISGITLENGVLKFELDSGDEFSITMPATDTTLTQTGSAADAAKVGQLVSEIAAEINTLTNALAAKADAQATQIAISNLETALETMGAQLTFDERPTPGSTKGVTSRGIYHWGNEFLDPIDAVIGDPGSEVEISEGTVVIQPNIGFRSLVVAQLPDEGQPGILYFVAHPGAVEPNVYDEFVWTEDRFEQVGTTGGGDASIDDDVISTDSTWSSAKIDSELHLQQWVNCTKPIQIADHLYEITYSDWNEEEALAYFEQEYPPFGGGCTAVRKLGKIGRNFDWLYNDEAEFVVKCPARDGLHASVGVAGNTNRILDSEARDKVWKDMYNILPYCVVDGINDAGVFIECNVVTPHDRGETTGSNPESDHLLIAPMVARYVLDHADSAEHAIQLIAESNVRSTYNDTVEQEYHWMIADENKTYEVEFIENEMSVLEMMEQDTYSEEETRIPAIATNFYLTGWDWKGYDILTKANYPDTFDPETTTLNEHAVGVQRYDLVYTGWDWGDQVDVYKITSDAYYSKNYTPRTIYMTPWFYDEFNGVYGSGRDLSIYSDAEEYDEVLEIAQENFARHERDSSFWITCHTSIYDMKAKTLDVCSQESGEFISYSIPIPSEESTMVVTNVMPAPETGKYIMYNGNEDGYVNSALYKTETIDGTQKWVNGFVSIKENKITKQVFIPLVEIE